jgi:hypothetical protein
MPDPDRLDADPTPVDQVSSAPGRRPRAVAVVAIVLVALVVVGVVLAHRPQHPAGVVASPAAGGPSSPAGPGSSPTAAGAAGAGGGSVFLEHLTRCTGIDHRNGLTVAFAVTNLGTEPVQLLSATLLTPGSALRLTKVRIGGGRCAGGAPDQPVRLVSAARVVVAMSFGLGPDCPRKTGVQARVAFRAGGRLLHADSSELADLSRLTFAQC